VGLHKLGDTRIAGVPGRTNPSPREGRSPLGLQLKRWGILLGRVHAYDMAAALSFRGFQQLIQGGDSAEMESMAIRVAACAVSR
jgi:hypothetical protein